MKNRAQLIFVILVMHFIAGILLAMQFPSAFLQQASGSAVLVLLCLLLLLNSAYIRFNLYRKKALLSGSLYLLFILLGVWMSLRNVHYLQDDYFAKAKTDYLQVIIDEEPQVKATYTRFQTKVIAGYREKHRLNLRGKVLVTIKTKHMAQIALNYGDALLLPSSAITNIPPTQNEAEFDYAGWLASKNTYTQAYLPAHKVKIIEQQQGSKLVAFALALRKQQIDVFRKLIREPEALSVASTLILGYRSELDKDTLAAYSKTGTIHVLSVSGMHVGIIYVVLELLLSFLNRWPAAKGARALLIILLIWFYAALTGFSPSVLRSALMLSCFIIAKTLHRHSNSYNILAFSAFVLLIDNPLVLYDVGFQLSYCAVWGLIFLQPLLYGKWVVRWPIGDKLWQYLSFSLAAQLATFPLSIYYFHQFPVYFLLTNLCVMLPAALMMYLGFSILLLRLYVLGPLLEHLIRFTNAMLNWFADLPFSTVSGIWISKAELILLVVFLSCGIVCLQKMSKKSLALTLISLLFFQAQVAWRKLQANRQERVVTFNIKKHYAIAYIHAHQAIIYTDLSPQSAAFKYSIQPYFEKYSITEVQIKIGHQQLKNLKHIW